MADYGNQNASFMQQGAYGAQIPQNYGQQQQQFQQYQNYPNYQQFPYGDPSMPMGPPQNFAAPYEFRRRINKMNWDMIGKVDVATIAKTNDVQSIEFLMSPIAFANISVDDNEHFGSQACLHAFMILQLSVEYLLFKLNTTPPPSYYQQQQNQFNQQNQQQPVPNQTITNYEARIDLLNKDIKTRDMLINSLSDKMRQAESERDALRAKLQSLTNKGNKDGSSSISDEISEIPIKRNARKRSVKDETGLMHPDSDLEEYRENKLKIKSKSSSKKGSSKKGKKNDESYEYSYSYYDYSESDIIPPPPPSSSSKKKNKNKQNKKKNTTKDKKKESVSTLGLYDDDWPSSSPWN